jgi:NADH-quinone oxidoreductase subunit N
MIGYFLSGLAYDIQQCHMYSAVYICNIMAIFIIILNYRVHNSDSMDVLHSFSSMFLQNRWIFLSLSAFFFSMAGVPPFAGFFAKFFLFSALGFHHANVSSCVRIIAALCSIYYYIKVIREVYYEDGESHFFFTSTNYSAALVVIILFFVNLLFYELLGIFEG